MSIRRGHFGFTVVEMCLAMVITTMVMGSVAAFSMAMTTAWKSAEKTQAITVMGNQIAMRLQSEIRKARLIGACRAGSSDGAVAGAAIMLWMQDTNGDNYIQGDEVAMIEHDPATHQLNRFAMGQSDNAGTWSHSGTFTSSAVFDEFRQNRVSVKMAGGVYGAMFQTSGTAGTSLNPSVAFGLKLMVDDSQTSGANHRAIGGSPKLIVEYGSATLRAPKAQPSN